MLRNQGPHPPLRRSSRLATPTNFYIPGPAQRPLAPAQRRPLLLPQPQAPEVQEINNAQDAIIQEPIQEIAAVVDPSQDEDLSKIWVAYMDGSYSPATRSTGEIAGWAVVIIKSGGLPGLTEDEGEKVTELYGRVIIN